MPTNEDAETDADDRPIPGETVRHGTGVTSNRAFPTSRYSRHLDPFVLFERFHIEPDEGFPMHSHRGFEIVSYILDGGMAHEDSLGVSHTAAAGDAMRITAGGGIRHSEFPAGGAACDGLQLWVNLPREDKDADADYADASAEDLPTREAAGATITTVVGGGSPLDLRTEVEYLDVRVADAWTWSIPEGWSGFLYGVAGDGAVGGDPFGEGDVLPVTAGGDRSGRGDVAIAAGASAESTSDSTLRVVAVAGRPHGEPIRQRGPFVF